MPELLEGINDSTFMKKSKGRGNKLIEEPEITCTVKGQHEKWGKWRETEVWKQHAWSAHSQALSTGGDTSRVK